jgi:tetratricopeptide (TPR) repeat protein
MTKYLTETNAYRAAETILDIAQTDRPVIQDFCPLADSIEWKLGQRYWHERGSQAFLSDVQPVPYVVNNDGTLSRNAAEMLFAQLNAAERLGTLPLEIFTLELGIGVGLFARYFLDAFRDLCLTYGKDYYYRLCYIAGDRSEKMLLDACRHGIFAHHPGRYLLRVVDALHPQGHLLKDLAFLGRTPKLLRAVFLNYVLDCLPATVLEVKDNDIRQLCVRTRLARGTNLEDYTKLTTQQLAQRVGSADPQDQRDLLSVYGLFSSEYDYQPVDMQRVPYGDFALRFAQATVGRVLHCHGAIRSLAELMELLHDDGFILINDYGQTEASDAEEFEHQRFSHATSIGVNFALLKSYFADLQECCWVEPLGENQHIHSRLLGHRSVSEVSACFEQCFGKQAWDRTDGPWMHARELVQAGRVEAAASGFRIALDQQPRNWVLMLDVAMFLIHYLHHPKAGVDMAKLALQLNPISSDLWNALGEGLFEFGRVEEATQAYLHAERLNTKDVRARYNLACAYEAQKDYAMALQKIAEGIALDWTGQGRERLLRKQVDILARMDQRNQQESQRLANRISPEPLRRNESYTELRIAGRSNPQKSTFGSARRP